MRKWLAAPHSVYIQENKIEKDESSKREKIPPTNIAAEGYNSEEQTIAN